MSNHHRPLQLPVFPRCRQRMRQGSQPPAIRNLNRVQAWLIALTLLQGLTLLTLIRLGHVSMRWSVPSPRPEAAFSCQARGPSLRGA
jgi:hypothetical protein